MSGAAAQVPVTSQAAIPAAAHLAILAVAPPAILAATQANATKAKPVRLSI